VTDTNVFQLSQPGNFADPLTEVLRKGARALLAQAVEAEVATLLSRYADETTDDGRKRLVRHGHLPEREISALRVTGGPCQIVRSQGVPVRGVALMGGKGPTIIATREEAGITRVEDLRGKSISTIGFQDSTYFALLAMLASANIKRDDANIQALGPAGAIQLFVKGNVEVCACIPDWLVIAEDAGLKVRFMPSSD
jgi:hypothetical protein